MDARSETYRRRADDCDAAADRVTDPEIRSVYLAIGARSRKMAEQQQAIEDYLSKFGEPRGENREHGNP
jgi:hypothetical protein